MFLENFSVAAYFSHTRTVGAAYLSQNAYAYENAYA